MKIQHLVVTRFNLQPWKGDRPRQHLDPDWLDGRLEAFRRTCVPCLAAQTVQDFTWYLIIDPETSAAFRAALLRVAPRLQLVEVASHDMKGRATRDIVLAACATAPTDLVIQSRLDSDDAVAPGYLETLRAGVRAGHTEFHSMRRGYQLNLDSGHAFARTWDSSPFMSLAHPPTRHPISIYDIPHFKVARAAPLRTVDDEGMWLQLLHDRNVSSELLPGRPVRTEQIASRFPIDPTLLAPRGPREAVTDLATWAGARARAATSPRSLARALPSATVATTRRRRRRERIARALASLRATAPLTPSSEQVDALLEAWSADHRTPATSFLQDVAAAAADGGQIVECGAGVTTLLLSVYAPERTWTLEPDGAWKTAIGELLEQIEADGHRLIAPGAANLPTSGVTVLLGNHAGPHHLTGRAYDLLPRLIDHVVPDGAVLLDDAHEALSNSGVASLLDQGRIRWEIAHVPVKPYVRGHAVAPGGSHVANVRKSSLPESNSA